MRSDEDFDSLDEGVAIERFKGRVQSRLLKSHGSLLIKGKRPREATPAKPRRLRPWKPLRPALAKAAAALIKDGVGVVEVPLAKRGECIVPLKIFSRAIATELAGVDVGAGLSGSSIKYAVAEVAAAVFGEVQALQERGETGVVHLHCTTDAAWKGSAARGGGLAMDEEGKKLVEAAAARVVEKLGEPALQISKPSPRDKCDGKARNAVDEESG